jgi:hypothetical protein
MIKFDTKKIKTVSIDMVKPNTWNPKQKHTEEQKKIKKGIELKGQRLPIIVRETDKGYEILDGEQRYTSCLELGFKEVLIYNEGKVSDKEAKELTIWYQQQVPFDDLELSELLKDLSQYPDLELPYTDEEIKDITDLDMDFEDEPEFNGGVRTLLIKMPEDQFKVITSAIKKVQEELGSNDARALEFICVEFLNSAKGTTGLNQV